MNTDSKKSNDTLTLNEMFQEEVQKHRWMFRISTLFIVCAIFLPILSLMAIPIAWDFVDPTLMPLILDTLPYIYLGMGVIGICIYMFFILKSIEKYRKSL